jgi:hypothetical protein
MCTRTRVRLARSHAHASVRTCALDLFIAAPPQPQPTPITEAQVAVSTPRLSIPTVQIPTVQMNDSIMVSGSDLNTARRRRSRPPAACACGLHPPTLLLLPPPSPGPGYVTRSQQAPSPHSGALRFLSFGGSLSPGPIRYKGPRKGSVQRRARVSDCDGLPPCEACAVLYRGWLPPETGDPSETPHYIQYGMIRCNKYT